MCCSLKRDCCYRLRKATGSTTTIRTLHTRVRHLMRTSLPVGGYDMGARSTRRLFRSGKVGSGRQLLRCHEDSHIGVCRLSKRRSCCCNCVIPSAKCLKIFSLRLCRSKFILLFPGGGKSRIRPLRASGGLCRALGRSHD